jgi:Ser/Thr protein kinase RdoA (MazF antagonist)
MTDSGSSTVDRAPRFSPERAAELASELYGVHATARGLPSERDQNFHLATARGDEYVLKIANPAESRDVLELQNEAMGRLTDAWRTDDAVTAPCPRIVETMDGEPIATAEGPDGRSCFVRLATYIPGSPLARFRPHTPELLRDLGRFFGRVDRALDAFDHRAAHRDFYWDLVNAGEVVRRHAGRIADRTRRAIAERFLSRFESGVVPVLADLRRGVIHGDGNDHNVLVDDGDPWRPRVAGVIDFGDMVHSHTVCEPAIVAAYALLGKKDPLAAAATVVGGYNETWIAGPGERVPRHHRAGGLAGAGAAGPHPSATRALHVA